MLSHHDKNLMAARLSLFFVSLWAFSSISLGGERIKVPVRWCGVEGAPSMFNPGVVNEGSTDDVLWRRHERPTDKIYIPMVDMQFRAGATAEIKNGPQSFPIIRDPQGSGGNILYDTGEASEAANLCRRAWEMGDPLYFDQNNNGVVNDGSDTLLSTDSPIVGNIEIGHDGAPIQPAPIDVRFVDHLTSNGQFDIGERIYRDENEDGFVDAGDTLLTGTEGTVVGDINPGDVTAPLLPVPEQIKYVDLIRQPPNTFNIGYPAVQGIIAVSANDFEVAGIGFPVHGVAIGGVGGNSAVMDDPSQYLPAGPDFTLFETQLVAHEFGHAMGLEHGDGIDDDRDGNLDNGDDPAAPIPDAGPGTLCDQDNVMQYCWRDNGSSGMPDMEWIGVGDPSFGVFTHDQPGLDQKDVLRNHALTNISDREVDPVTPPLESTRTDAIGDVPSPFEHIDITNFSVVVDASRTNTKFSLQTRRPFPKDIVPVPATIIDTEDIDRLNFHFIVDIDGNPLSGGSPADINVPTDFVGAEYVITVNLEGGRVLAVTLFKHNSTTGLFAPVTGVNIRAVRETIEAIVDFPGSLRDPDPDNFTGALIDLAVSEEITVIVPNGILEESFGSRFRVEYISHAVQDDVIDRARTQGMNFDLPVFPDCTTDPGVVRAGEMTKVNATGLLPNRDVEVFLGDIEVGKGTADSNGNVTVEFSIPSDSTGGDRLVTVGAFAVTADCSVVVEVSDRFPEVTKCYYGKQIPPFTDNNPQLPFPTIASVTLNDQFARRETDVRFLQGLCNPAGKNAPVETERKDHLSCYSISDAPGQPLFFPGLIGEIQIETENFGEDTVKLGHALELCVSSENKNGQFADIGDFKCYSARSAQRDFPNITLDDQFFVNKPATIERLSRFCTPVGKNQPAPPENPEAFNHLACYDIGRDRLQPQIAVNLTDQFIANAVGQDITFTAEFERRFCEPARKISVKP